MKSKVGMPMSFRLVSCVLLVACTGCFHFDRTLAPGQLRGTAVVLDAQSKLGPAAGATVVLEGSGLVVTTDSHGVFSITGLPAGKYAIDVSSQLTTGTVGLRLQGLSIPLADGLDLGQIELGAVGAIQGTVTLGGEPAPEGGVAAVAGVLHTGITGGTFLLPGLLPGDYAVSVLVPQDPGAIVSPAATVHVNPGATVSTTFGLTTGEVATAGAVQGSAELSGATTNSGVDIQFSGGGPDLSSSSAGTYSAMSVPVGLYTVTASLGGFNSVSIPFVIVAGGTNSVPGITLFAVGTPGADAGTDAGFACAIDSDCSAGLVCVALSCVAPVDAGTPDAGPTDAGPTDAGTGDAGTQDAGRTDAGPTDAGPVDAGPTDAGPMDAGPAPVISNLATNATTFSEVAGFNQIIATFDVSVPCSVTATANDHEFVCGTYQTTSPSFTCTYAVQGNEGSGDVSVFVMATDSGGEDSKTVSVVFDFTALILTPSVSPDFVNASTSDSPVLQVTSNKPLPTAPTATVTPVSDGVTGTIRAGTLSGSGTSWSTPLTLNTPPHLIGDFTATVQGTDDVGHAASASTNIATNTVLPMLLNVGLNATTFSAVASFDTVVVTFRYYDSLDTTGATGVNVTLGGFTAGGMPLSMTCAPWQATLPNYTCTYTVTGTELDTDGVTPISTEANATLPVTIAATDSVGNMATSSMLSVTFDFTPPTLSGTPTLSLVPAPNPLTAGTPAACLNASNPINSFAGVTAATICTDIQVFFIVSEALSGAVVTDNTGIIPFTAFGNEGTFYRFDGAVTVPGVPVDGTYGLSIVATDLVGNAATFHPDGPTFNVDTTPPPAPATGASGPVTYTRVPWGSAATGGPSFVVTGNTGTLEAGDVFLVLDGPLPTANVISSGTADLTGALGSVSLDGTDRPVVWIASIDEAGNESPIVAVHNVSWTASYANKTTGSTTSNPHVMLAGSATTLTPVTGGSLAAGGSVFGAVEPAFNPAIEIPDYSGLYPGADSPLTTNSNTTWLGPLSPTPNTGDRQDGAMAYDSARGVTVLFGGLNDALGYLSDTWEWNGTSWTQLTPATSPVGRWAPLMAYDSARGVTTLYGGGGGAGYLNDTWEWNGTTWTQLFPPNSPGGIVGGAMAYDSARGVMVVFGGETPGATASTNTWEWDGTTWTEQSPVTVPPGRNSQGMAYDEQRGVMVMYGGLDSPTVYGDLWEWNGTNWTQPPQPAFNPGSRAYLALAWDAAHGVTVLFGGDNDSGYLNDTWTWDGTTWRNPFTGTAPSVRAENALAYDAAHGTVVLTGGTNNGTTGLNDTWLWNGTTWYQPAPVASVVSARTGGALAFDAARGVDILFGGTNASGTPLNDTWAFDGRTWTSLTPDGSPTARIGTATAFDAAHGEIVLFGGQSSGTDLSDFYEWNGSSWVSTVSSNTPPARSFHTMAYDATHGVTVMFGGDESGSGGSNDTWTWDGNDWTQQFSGTTPSGRTNAAMVYDAALQETILFGGESSTLTSPLNDTWAWTGSGWENVSPSGSPAGRFNHGMAYDATLGVVIMTGGTLANGVVTNETWQFNGTTWTQVFPSSPAPTIQGQAITYDAARAEVVELGGTNGTAPTNTTWLLPSAVSTYPVDIAQFDFGSSGETFGTVSVEQLSLKSNAGGTGYSNPGPTESGTASTGVALGGWNSAAPGSWTLLNTTSSPAVDTSPLSYTTSTPWQASNDSIAGPWQTIDFTFFPLQSNGTGFSPGEVVVADPELTVQYLHLQSACTASDNGCLCAADETACNGVCSDTTIDPQNCGGCAAAGGKVCTGGAWCVGGNCACPGTEQLCNGVCTDINNDPLNCGGCNSADAGTACSPFATCSEGTCTAPTGCTPESCLTADAGPTTCNLSTGQCAQCNTNADCACTTGISAPFACQVPAYPFCNPSGTCVQCLVDGDCAYGTCTSGVCQACPADAGMEVGCSGVCTNTSSDPNNCGGCGIACPSGDGCQNSRCYAP